MLPEAALERMPPASKTVRDQVLTKVLRPATVIHVGIRRGCMHVNYGGELSHLKLCELWQGGRGEKGADHAAVEVV
jgi:hypothetical protein